MYNNKQQRKRTPLDTVKLIISKMGFDYSYLSDIIASYEEYLKDVLPENAPERIDKYYEIQAKSKYILTYQGIFKEWLMGHQEWLRNDVEAPIFVEKPDISNSIQNPRGGIDKKPAEKERYAHTCDRKTVMSQLKKVLLDNGYYVGSSEAADILRALADVWDD